MNYTYTITPKNVGYPSDWIKWVNLGEETIKGFVCDVAENEQWISVYGNRYQGPRTLTLPRIVIQKNKQTSLLEASCLNS